MDHSDRSRPRGILTEKDRRYLMDNVVPDAKQARYERKKGARERITNGVLDFPYLRFMPPEERRKIFTNMEPSDSLYWSLASIIGFAKYACDDAGLPVEELLEQGLELGYKTARGDLEDHGAHTPEEMGSTEGLTLLDDVDVNIELKYREVVFPDMIKTKISQGDDLSDSELMFALESDEFEINVTISNQE